jgi:NAD(P)H dehydrogenase (quinone)
VVACKTLFEDCHEYATYELTGFSMTLAELVQTAGRIRGVELSVERVAPCAAPLPARLTGDPEVARSMRAMFEEYDRHGLPGNSNVLAALLGRPPHTLETVAERVVATAGSGA